MCIILYTIYTIVSLNAQSQGWTIGELGGVSKEIEPASKFQQVQLLIGDDPKILFDRLPLTSITSFHAGVFGEPVLTGYFLISEVLIDC